MLQLIDSHAHLDLVPEVEEALLRARDAGVSAVVAVGIDYESNSRVLELAAKHRGFVHPALGIHPYSLAEGKAPEPALKLIEDHVRDVVAVGEVGLDYARRILAGAGKERQKAVLAMALEVARRHNKAVAFHSRYAWCDSCDMVRDSGANRVVFHWYAGPANVLRDILASGYSVSATPAAAYHEEHRRVLRASPLDRILVETDAPVEYRQGAEFARPSEPADVVAALHALASLKGLDPAEAAARTTENARKLFRLP